MKREANLSLTYQRINLDGHFDTDGSRLPDSVPSRAHVGIAEIEYGLTDRLTVNARLPFIASKFTGDPNEAFLVDLRELTEQLRKIKAIPESLTSLDTGGYYSTFQDFGFLLRYNLFERPLVVTPLVGLTIPSHDYRTVGEAAPGANLRALHIGVNVGRLLDPVIPRTYIHAKYVYSFSERAYDEALNRSGAEFEAGYGVTPIVTVRALGTWSQGHGGMRFVEAHDRAFGLDGTPPHPELLLDHDRLMQSRYWHVGGGTTVSLTDTIDLDAAVLKYVSGSDTHFGVGVSAGITWRIGKPAPLSSPSLVRHAARR